MPEQTKTLLLCDDAFGRQEHALLQRLALGLADEGGETWILAPSTVTDHFNTFAGPRLVSIPWPRLPIPTAARLRTALAALAQHRVAPPYDVVHVFGDRALRLGAALAQHGSALLAVEVCGPIAAALPRWLQSAIAQRRAPAAGTSSASDADRAGPVLLVASDAELAQSLRELDTAASLCTAPWGVHRGPAPARPAGHSAPIHAILLTARRDRPCDVGRAAGEAAIALLKERPHLAVFADERAAARHRWWSLARHAGVNDRFTLIDDPDSRRDLVTAVDLAVFADPSGLRRSLLLDTMMAARPIIACPGPADGSVLSPEKTTLVRTPGAEAWRQAITAALESPARVRAMADAARDYLLTARRLSLQVAALQDAYEAALARPMPMSMSAASENR